MSLLNAANANANKFESEDSTMTDENQGANQTAAAPATQTHTTTANTGAVAVQGSRALTTGGKRQAAGALEHLREALPVEYNTLTQIIATNGNFQDRENKTVLGDTVVFNALSFQSSFVLDPGDEDAPDGTVKYSDDGVVTTEGIPVPEALEDMMNRGYPKARLKERTIVVGGVVSASKTDAYNESLVQFDLSPKSRVQWDRYRANQAYRIKVGAATEQDCERVKATTEIAQGPDKKAFTVVKFEVAK